MPAGSIRIASRRANPFRGGGRLRIALAALVALSVALYGLVAEVPGQAATSAGKAHAVIADAAGEELLAELNRVRTQHGSRPLHMCASLTTAAKEHSVGMALQGYFDHESPRGPSFEARLEHYYPPRAGRLRWVAENIFWATGAPPVKDAVAAFMNSPEHRAILLRPSWREIGVAVVHALHATGVYGGRNVTIITIDFGIR